jgi:hypothetical protein
MIYQGSVSISKILVNFISAKLWILESLSTTESSKAKDWIYPLKESLVFIKQNCLMVLLILHCSISDQTLNFNEGGYSVTLTAHGTAIQHMAGE